MTLGRGGGNIPRMRGRLGSMVLAALALAACEASRAPDPAPDPRPCARMIDTGMKAGLIRERQGAALHVDEAGWARLTARSKRLLAVMARCAARAGQPGTEGITGEIIGLHSGKLLAIASRETTSLFD